MPGDLRAGALAAAFLVGAILLPATHTVLRRGAVLSRAAVAASSTPAPAAAARAVPVSFVPNVGETDARVKFLAPGPDGTVFLTARGAVVELARPHGAAPDVLRISLAHARRPAAMAAAGRLPGSANYLSGAARSGWHVGLPTYRAVTYRSVYPGVDLRYEGTGGRLEYDFELAPGARPGVIAVELSGSRDLAIDSTGKLDIRLAHSALVEDAPRAYQDLGGHRRPVRARFVLRGRAEVGFALGPYDRHRPLVIDPTLAYATLLHGSAEDAGRAIAVDSAGDAFVTGDTSSPDFPTAHPLARHAKGSGFSAFVVELSPRGTVLYSTYLGGAGYTSGRGIAVDTTGAAYVTGATNSTSFPITSRALQRSYGGGPFDAFVTKLNPAGMGLVYSTYLGDTHYDEGNGIAIDGQGRAVVTGRSVSPNFPAVGHLQPHVDGGAFVVRLNRTGTALTYATVFGGNDTGNHGDTGFAVAVDASGAAYATGLTNATDFPTVHALQRSPAGGSDAFAVKINAAGTAVVYCTYLGGSGNDRGLAIAADANGDAYIAGDTTSHDFPTRRALQRRNAGARGSGANAFITELSPTGRRLVFSTYLGGTGEDTANGLALTGADQVYVTGETTSTDFPLARPRQRLNAGGSDGFVAELGRGGSPLVRSTYLGGRGNDSGVGIAVGRTGTVYVTGVTASPDFPARPARGGRKVSTRLGTSSAFVVALPTL